MSKCVCCKYYGESTEAVWTWQPFGPADDTKLFVRPGYHYRGYPALPICDDCKQITESGGTLEFTYKGQTHSFIYKEQPDAIQNS